MVYLNGQIIHEEFTYLGLTTNNQAEYQALLQALRYLSKNNLLEAKFFSDSELMVKQILKLYKVKDLEIQKIYNEVTKEMIKFKKFEIQHVRREKNKVADMLVNKCLDEH